MRVSFAALVLALAVPAGASAATIIVTFTGTVSFVATQIASGFTVGDPISGTFRYDSTLTDVVADPGLGIYLGPTAFEFDFGGYVATANAPGSAVQVDNDAMGTGLFDRYIASKTCNNTCTAADVAGFALFGMTFLVSGPSTIFADDSLPTSLDLTDFTQRSASFEFSNGVVAPVVSALVQSVTFTVPEPRLALLALGGFALAALARGRPSPRG